MTHVYTWPGNRGRALTMFKPRTEEEQDKFISNQIHYAAFTVRSSEDVRPRYYSFTWPWYGYPLTPVSWLPSRSPNVLTGVVQRKPSLPALTLVRGEDRFWKTKEINTLTPGSLVPCEVEIKHTNLWLVKLAAQQCLTPLASRTNDDLLFLVHQLSAPEPKPKPRRTRWGV